MDHRQETAFTGHRSKTTEAEISVFNDQITSKSMVVTFVRPTNVEIRKGQAIQRYAKTSTSKVGERRSYHEVA